MNRTTANDGNDALAPSAKALDLVRLAGHCDFRLRVVEIARGYNLALIDNAGIASPQTLTNTAGKPLTYPSPEAAERDVDDRLIGMAQERARDQVPAQQVEHPATDIAAADLGGRTRGAWYGDGQSIAPPKPLIEDVSMTERQSAAAWGYDLHVPSREPSERALELVEAAGSGGYVLAVMEARVGGTATGAYHIALVDTNGVVTPELLKNQQGNALTYPTAERAAADRERLIELAHERQQEQALEDEHDIERGLSR